MNPLLLALLGGEGLKGLISGLTGGHQLAEARREEAVNKRPVETVPQGVLDAASYAKLLSFMGMPAEQFNAAMRDINRAGTTTIAAARDRRGAIDVASTVQQATNDATLNLEGKSAEMRVDNTKNYINQLGVLGQWQDKIWGYNAAQKYEENAAAIRALKTAGHANINTAENAILSGLTTFATGGGFDKKNADTQIATGVISDAGTQDANPDMQTDPTVTNPELFNSGVPTGLIKYLSTLKLPG